MRQKLYHPYFKVEETETQIKPVIQIDTEITELEFDFMTAWL